MVGDARLAVAEEHQARARDARADGLPGRRSQARPQPRRQPASASPTRTSSRSWAASPTCSCRATATSRARSTRASRSLLAKPRPRPRGLPRSSPTSYLPASATSRATQPPRSGRRRLFGEAEARDGAPRTTLADRAAAARGHGRHDPFAELKNRIHVLGDRGPRAAALQRRASTRPRCASASSPRSAASSTQETGLSRDDREQLASELADDILGHGPLERLLADDTVTEIMVNGPYDVWIERDGQAAPDRRAVPGRVAPAADHQQDRRPGRPADRRVLADGRRAPARRQPHQRRSSRRCRSSGRC